MLEFGEGGLERWIFFVPSRLNHSSMLPSSGSPFHLTRYCIFNLTPGVDGVEGDAVVALSLELRERSVLSSRLFCDERSESHKDGVNELELGSEERGLLV